MFCIKIDFIFVPEYVCCVNEKRLVMVISQQRRAVLLEECLTYFSHINSKKQMEHEKHNQTIRQI
jgi:hypothetical protein